MKGTGLQSIAVHHSTAVKHRTELSKDKAAAIDQYLKGVFKHYLAAAARRVSSHVNSSLPRVPPHSRRLYLY